MRPPSRPPSRPAPTPSRRAPVIAIAAVVVACTVIWFLRPSGVSRVRNLESRGTAIVAFGDSLTAGYGAGAGEDYPSRLAGRVGVAVVNAGVSGDTTDSALPRVETDVLGRDPRIVIVGLGGNDFLRQVDLATTERNLRAIVRHVQGAGAMVVLLGFRFPSLQANYEAMYERIAEDEGCLLVPDLLDGILSDPALRSDAIHPNARGYELLAERVADPLRELIDEANERRR